MFNLFYIEVEVILKQAATWFLISASLAYSLLDPTSNSTNGWPTSPYSWSDPSRYKGLPFYE